SKESVMNLIDKTFHNTQAAQIAISPEFTMCNGCYRSVRGLKDSCSYCGSSNVYGITRIVGYFSRVNNWNKSKIGELKDRKKGNYRIG
ncbi:MAG: anaerobic ribonucleoside-triphosphate reductase, partial [Candidatus Omnitrophica bacterium]|nr:anaerobic ribonucleoside-triphosphate reductase [Candidatus Omnitrophota bacterium]